MTLANKCRTAKLLFCNKKPNQKNPPPQICEQIPCQAFFPVFLKSLQVRGGKEIIKALRPASAAGMIIPGGSLFYFRAKWPGAEREGGKIGRPARLVRFRSGADGTKWQSHDHSDETCWLPAKGWVEPPASRMKAEPTRRHLSPGSYPAWVADKKIGWAVYRF